MPWHQTSTSDMSIHATAAIRHNIGLMLPRHLPTLASGPCTLPTLPKCPNDEPAPPLMRPAVMPRADVHERVECNCAEGATSKSAWKSRARRTYNSYIDRCRFSLDNEYLSRK